VNVSEASELPVSPVVRNLLQSARQTLSPAQASTKRLIDQAISLLDGESADETMRCRAGRLSGGLAPWQERRVSEFIDKHIALPLPVRTLAASVKLSRCHFCRAFKRGLGVSPHAYIMRKRVQKAQELMLVTDEPLVRIALLCGLASQSHLCQIFRRVTGCSPSVWRGYHRLGDRDAALPGRRHEGQAPSLSALDADALRWRA
jgi:AraC family transcriptional regulator